jgi:hypothetical protein
VDFLLQLQKTSTGGFVAAATENFYRWISCLSSRRLLQVDFLLQLQRNSTGGFLAAATEDFWLFHENIGFPNILQKCEQCSRKLGIFIKKNISFPNIDALTCPCCHDLAILPSLSYPG